MDFTQEASSMTDFQSNHENDVDNENKVISTELDHIRPPLPMKPLARPLIIPAKTDRYGFYKNETKWGNASCQVTVSRKAAWLENRRTEKWLAMLLKFEKYLHQNPLKVKSRIRKGIPDAVRGIAWRNLAGSANIVKENPGTYRRYLSRKEFPCQDTILRDIRRTFPQHSMFTSENSVGQVALTNLLLAYSVFDPEVGYCQGMGFISAMFLSYMPEEEAFWLLVTCMTKRPYEFSQLFRPGMPKVTECLSVLNKLIKIYLPNLYKHFDKENIHPSMYASQWFITLYSYSFSFELVTWIWDIFLFEGWKIVFRVALALLKLSEDSLLEREFEEIMEFFRYLPRSIEGRQVMKVALSIPLRRAQMKALATECAKGR